MTHLNQIEECCAHSLGLEVTVDGNVFGTCPDTLEQELILAKDWAEAVGVKDFDSAVDYLTKEYPWLKHTRFVNMGGR